MHFSIATVSLPGTLDAKLRAAANAGFDGVELFVPDIEESPMPLNDITSLMDELGLSCDLYQPVKNLLSVKDKEFQHGLRRCETALAHAKQLGTNTILVCSNTDSASVDSDEVRVDQLRQIGKLAADQGMRVAFEALAWGRFVSTFAHAYDIVRHVDLPNVGVCLDSFHMLALCEDPSVIDSVDPSKLFFVQLADAPRLDIPVKELSRHHRQWPGHGDLPVKECLAKALNVGYSGPVSLEIFNDSLDHDDPEAAAADAYQALVSVARR
ncbi:sugar phosphate isomerase/epimerase family protein [Corynebacterium parakroppenstedtii]|uniref:sugar phosphate isomerase/epimerase family protein n=1 Tax=Corynebacterium parakroppenstedtii TaxID=2828363 RepID=UPI001C8D8F1F|nr:sugar phosphate isomerase/epimerase family protein [Corynebacterium parakroppenstedtii]MBY0788480.1 sugar phosphate isomerase/epimerase [Corynebacterium parakroppenstedtii]